MPCSRRGAGLRFTIADDAADDQIWVVHYRAETDTQSIPEFSALVNGPGSFGADVTGKAPCRTEATDRRGEPFGFLGATWIELGQGPLEPQGCQNGRCSVTRT